MYNTLILYKIFSNSKIELTRERSGNVAVEKVCDEMTELFSIQTFKVFALYAFKKKVLKRFTNKEIAFWLNLYATLPSISKSEQIFMLNCA